MHTIFDVFYSKDLSESARISEIAQILEKDPEAVNTQQWHTKNTLLHLAILGNFRALIKLCLEVSCLKWGARNYLNQTILFAAAQVGNTALFERLLTEPKFAQTLQSHSDRDKHNLLYIAIIQNHAEIIPLLCEQFPDVIFQREQDDDWTPLHSLGVNCVNSKTFAILRYLLRRPDIERSLEIQNLAKILFDGYQEPRYSPIIPVILNHYLHHSTPEHDEANKHHLENYLVQCFCFNSQSNVLRLQPFFHYLVIAKVLVYYEKKFIDLDGLYKQIVQRGGDPALECLHYFRQTLEVSEGINFGI